jgi:drug/metabolite transporter (DMT)-like permease
MSLIAYAVRRKVWLLGCLGLVAGFLLQAFALHVGRLTIVQPILTLELPFLVAILAFWFRNPLRWQEWTGALVATAGLGLFLALAVPSGGNLVPGLREWGVAALAIIMATALTVALAQTGRPAWRAAMFGASAAIMFAFTAALIKQVTAEFNFTPTAFLTHWHVYAMAITGLLAVFLAQNAFHAGPVTASQAALVIVDPLASMAIGVALFGDTIHTEGPRGPLEIAALLGLFAGAAVLSRSPLVEHIRTEEPTSSSGVGSPPTPPTTRSPSMTDQSPSGTSRFGIRHPIRRVRPADHSR